ncbi:MAG: amidohydrolase, partial [Thermoplasmata archaeon]
DRLVPDRPTYLDRICGHVSALNTAALERVGVRRGTRAHRGGRIGRGRDGEPNGLLVDGEVGRTNTLRRAAFRSRPAATRRLLKAWSDLGTTTVGAMYVDAEEFSELGQLSRARALPVGIRAYLRLEQYARRAPPTSGPDVHFAGVKAILDGSLGSRTAWLEQAYSDDPGERGHSLWAPAKLLGALRPAADAGHPIALHAIGDRALAEAIRTLEALGSPESSRIEHASVSPPAQLRRIARTGATVVIQPGFRTSDRWRTARLGVRRGRWTHAFARLAAAGIPLAGSSDAPVERADPWSGMRSASGRVSPGPDPHRLTPAQALGAYTVGGARALADPTLGSLVPGSPADLLVLAGSSPWEGIRAGRSPVLSTWRSGRRVAVLGAVPARSG